MITRLLQCMYARLRLFFLMQFLSMSLFLVFSLIECTNPNTFTTYFFLYDCNRLKVSQPMSTGVDFKLSVEVEEICTTGGTFNLLKQTQVDWIRLRFQDFQLKSTQDVKLMSYGIAFKHSKCPRLQTLSFNFWVFVSFWYTFWLQISLDTGEMYFKGPPQLVSKSRNLFALRLISGGAL